MGPAVILHCLEIDPSLGAEQGGGGGDVDELPCQQQYVLVSFTLCLLE